jgi:hypothetical protein
VGGTWRSPVNSSAARSSPATWSWATAHRGRGRASTSDDGIEGGG